MLARPGVVLGGVLVYVVAGVAVTERWHNHRRHPGGAGVARCQASMRCPAHARTRREREAGRRAAGYHPDPAPAGVEWVMAA